MAFQDFDLISQRREEEKKKRFKQRLILAFVVSVMVILLAATAVCFAIYKIHRGNNNNISHRHPPPPLPRLPKMAQNVVKSVCATTDYKKTCEASIMKEVKNNVSATPMEILRASLAAASHEIDSGAKKAKDMKFDTPMKKAAYNVRLILFNDAKDDLNSSIWSIEGKDITNMSTVKHELNNWLSAVISYQQTCIDGFPDGSEKENMTKILASVRILGSNALAVVSYVSFALSRLKSPANPQRRLLGFDAWMNQENCSVLKADAAKFTPNVTVAKDNTGNFTTINEALKAMPKMLEWYTKSIKIKHYKESIN